MRARDHAEKHNVRHLSISFSSSVCVCVFLLLFFCIKIHKPLDYNDYIVMLLSIPAIRLTEPIHAYYYCRERCQRIEIENSTMGFKMSTIRK